MSRAKRRVRDALIIAIVTLVMLAAIEGLIRAAYLVRNAAIDVVLLPYTAAQDWGVIPPWVDGLRLLQTDDVLLWRSRPNVHRTYLDVYGPARSEADRVALLQQFIPRIPEDLRRNPVWDVSINTMGFREREFSRDKRPSTFRIVCLGDSWTFGANVPQAQAYPRHLARLLRDAHPNADIEVLNLGVMGYTSRQGLELLRREVLDLQPDLILIGFAMNDAIVSGWRDSDSVGRPSNSSWSVTGLVKGLELYKLAHYWRRRVSYRPWSLGDYLDMVGRADGTPDAIWTGRDAAETADYDELEAVTRVSPRDYERNLTEMITAARHRGAEVVLLFNDLWATPYRSVVSKVADAEGVPWIDSKALIDDLRHQAEDALERRLGLQPPVDVTSGPADRVEVVFRVSSARVTVDDALYVTGNDPVLGAGVPNLVALHDDGTHGDQRAGDGVWSYVATFEPNRRLFYVYTNSGRERLWEGLDVPDLRRLIVPPEPGRRIYRPIETFGSLAFQADGWHTNAIGYERIARAAAEVVAQQKGFRTHAEQ